MQFRVHALQGVLVLGLLFAACEKIDPRSSSGPSLDGEAVVLTCEGCHVTRSFLRKLAVAGEEAASGGG